MKTHEWISFKTYWEKNFQASCRTCNIWLELRRIVSGQFVLMLICFIAGRIDFKCFGFGYILGLDRARLGYRVVGVCFGRVSGWLYAETSGSGPENPTCAGLYSQVIIH